MTSPVSFPSRLLTIADLAVRWQIAERTVRRRVKDLRLPICRVVGRTPRFRVSDVEAVEARMAGQGKKAAA